MKEIPGKLLSAQDLVLYYEIGTINQRHRRDKCGMTAERYCVRLFLGSNPSLSFQNGEI
jgi:hypothetical protein